MLPPATRGQQMCKTAHIQQAAPTVNLASPFTTTKQVIGQFTPFPKWHCQKKKKEKSAEFFEYEYR